MPSWLAQNESKKLFMEISPLISTFELDDAAKPLDWGFIQGSENLNELLVHILPILNEYFRAEIKPENASIVLAGIKESFYHGIYQRIVPNAELLRDNDGYPLPVRIYIPVENGMQFQINGIVCPVLPGEFVCVPNGHSCDFRGFRWEDESKFGQPTKFLIIDIPPYNPDYDHMVVSSF